MPLPVLGIHEASAKADQPVGTTRMGNNARGVDPRTGEVRLAQRAGMSPFLGDPVDANGARVDHVAQASTLVPVREWRALDIPSEEIVGSLPEEPVDVFFGPENDVYTLLASGAVVIFNQSGGVVRRITSRTPVGFTTIPRIRVDAQGAVYTAAMAQVELDGAASRVYRQIRRLEDPDNYQLFWEHPILGQIRDFDVRDGALDIAEHGLIDTDEEGEAFLTRVLNLSAGAPVSIRRRRVAFPVANVSTGFDGSTFVSSRPNESRSGAGFSNQVISWTPRELEDWETLLRTHLRIPSEGFEDGQDVGFVGDNRFRDSSFGVTEDEAIRPLRRDLEGFRPLYDAPTFLSDDFGGTGGLRFGQQSGLRSDGIRGLGADDQLGLFPGDTPFLFSTAIQVISEGAPNMHILSQEGGGSAASGQGSYTLSIDPDSRMVTLAVRDNNGTFQVFNGNYSADTNVVVVTFHYMGADQPSILRINGEFADSGIAGLVSFSGPFDVGLGESEAVYTAIGDPRLENSVNQAPLFDEIYKWVPFSIQNQGPDVIATDQLDRLVDEDESFGSRVSVDPGDAIVFEAPSPVQLTAVEVVQIGVPSFQESFIFEAANDVLFADITYEEVLDIDVEFDDIAELTFPFSINQVLAEPVTSTFFRIRSGDGERMRITQVRFFSNDSSGVGREFSLHEVVVYAGGTSPPIGVNGTAPLGAPVEDVTDAELIEGYLHHAIGVADNLPSDHPYFGAGNPPIGIGDFEIEQGDLGALSSREGILAKFQPQGAIAWVATDDIVGGGIGYGHATGPDGEVYSIGVGDVHIRRIRDEGPSFETTGEDTWEYSNPTSSLAYAESPDNLRPYLSVDIAGQLYATLLGGTVSQVARFTLDGELGPVFLASGSVEPIPLAPVPAEPFFGDADIAGPEVVYSVFNRALRGFRYAEQFGPIIRRRRRDFIVAVAGGGVYAAPWDGSTQINGMSKVGSVQAGQEIRSTELQGRLFFADGEQIQYFDPLDGSFNRLEPRGSGTVLQNATCIAAWNNRLVLTDGVEWVMSRVGDFRDFDMVQVELNDEGQAVSSAVAVVGQVPDRITGILPLRDDLLLWLCEESIWRLTGNPITNGQQDRVSEEMGAAPDAWVRAPDGQPFILGSRGNVYILNQFGVPSELMGDQISRRLELLDLERFRVEMVWSEIERGFHVFFVDRDGCGPPDGFGLFLERPIQGKPWSPWYDTWSETRVMPTAAVELVGTQASQRLLLIGCEDGRLRLVAPNLPTDDGASVEFRVRVGPMSVPALESKCKGFAGVLAVESGRVAWELRGSDIADSTGPPKGGGIWKAGRNAGSRDRVRGAHIWMDLVGVPGEACAIEEISYRRETATRKQPR